MEDIHLDNCTVSTNCSEPPASVPCWTWSCFDIYSSPPPPSPPPPPPLHLSPPSHLTPYLVTGVGALGVAFLILLTCAILLRCRWSRRRNSISSPPSSRGQVFVDEDHIGPVDHPIWRIVTIGLPESVIDSITAFKYKKGDRLIDETDCSVCLTEFEDGDDLRLLPKCSHAFHLNCIDTWLRSHKNCPLCRAPVVNESYSSALNPTGFAPNLSEPGSSTSAQMGTQEQDQEEESEGSGMRDGVGDFSCTLPLAGTRIGQILKESWGNRALSDLSGNRRFRRGDLEPATARRSVSLDVSAAAAMNNAVAVNVAGEGSSKQLKLVEVKEAGEQELRECGSSISTLMKSSSIGCSLHKAPVSMKRSLSSSARFLSSFRGSKRHSSSSILPL